MADDVLNDPMISPPTTPQPVPDLYGLQIAHEASAEDLERDANRYTHPNLHRRVRHVDALPEGASGVDYSLFIQGGCSYRNTRYITHDEESTTSEIP